MFQRTSHKLPPDLLNNFKKGFPRTGLSLFGEPQELPPSPERSLSNDTEPAMNFNPDYGNPEDGTDQVSSPGNIGEWMPAEAFPNQHSDFFSFFSELTTPYQPTLASSSYGQPPQFFTSSVQLQDQQHGIPTPQSVSAANAVPFFTHGSYMNTHEQQMQALQESYNPNYSQFHQTSAQTGGRMDFPQNSDFITPDRLALPHKNAFDRAGGRFDEPDEQLRFRVILMTGTAMVKEGELPVTYLNKCQPYKVTIKDTRPEHYTYGPTTYRTFIRVSFNEQQQRERAAHCWQLWKDGRGITEAQQRGTKPFAVEYVPQNQNQHQGSSIMIQKEVFDGFCFQWTSPAGRPPECEIQLRCNFLSTDFSHSKGVKGIPVRLCAKTAVVATNHTESHLTPEVCFCKVKLFRDHGAERKLANDEAHVKKNITKLEEQMRQAQASHDESVLNSSGKRRPSDSYSIPGRPNKVAKLRRASSISSDSSGGLRETVDGDLQVKLATLNDTLRSKRDMSVLFLKGEKEDDPDEYPVELPDSVEPPSESPVDRNQQRRNTAQFTSASSGSPHAPTPTPTLARARHGSMTKSSTNDWRSGLKMEPDAELQSIGSQAISNPTDRPTKIETRPKLQLGVIQGSIEVSDVDPSYVPPEQQPRAVACFYVRYSMNGEPPSEPYYRAIYLRERSLSGFAQAISLKRNISPDKVSEIVLIRDLAASSGEAGQVQVKVDDEVVSDILEGQDMLADFSNVVNDPESAERDPKTIRYKLTIQFDEPPRS